MTQKSLFELEDESVTELETNSAEKAIWELAAEEDVLIAQVVMNRPMTTIYHYLVPDFLRSSLQVGQRIRVPFGVRNQSTVGFCVGLVQPTSNPIESKRKLKCVTSILDEQPLASDHMLQLTKWIAEYYLCSWGQVLHSVIPAGVKKKAGTKQITFFQLAEHAQSRLKSQEKFPPKQKRVIEVLSQSDQPLRREDIRSLANCGDTPINSLRKKGMLVQIQQRIPLEQQPLAEVPREADFPLNEEQHQACQSILKALRKGEHGTFLLHGVTGSGKTEVYIQTIREVVSYGRQAIVLVPEISLTPQTIRRFRARFPSVAVLHSHLSDGERHAHWNRIASGDVQVIVGARSAVFAPTPHLGLIIIDEEHETSFKQESIPRYHAREVARTRAMFEGIPLVLGSATPTLESWYRTQRESSQDETTANHEDSTDVLLTLKKRVEEREMPPVVIVDVRTDPQVRKGKAIGRSLQTAMTQALHDEGQIILFLNLRGHSPVIWCRACGESIRCQHCDITLTLHRDRKKGLCHACDYQIDPPKHCPSCGQPALRHLGTGTQKLEEEVRYLFPDTRVLRMDSDTMRKTGSHEEAFEQFRSGEVQILLGTQMIAKGLDFPNVTLVGVIDADTMLHQPDLRSSERTFHLISQVAGRTGRGERGGRVLVQSASPTEPAIRFAAEHDFAGFIDQELQSRALLQNPPYTHLARIILRGKVEEDVSHLAEHMASLIRQTVERSSLTIRVLGPAPAPISRLKEYYRYHFQLTSESVETIQQLWNEMSPRFPVTSKVEYLIDIDPLNLR